MGTEKAKKKLTAGLFAAWFFGIVLIIGAFGNVGHASFWFVIPTVLAGIILLPPTRAFAAERWNLELSNGLVAIIIIVLISISAANTPRYEPAPIVTPEPGVDTQAVAAIAPAPAAPPAKVRRALVTVDRVQVQAANLFPIRVTVENTGDVAITPQFDVTVLDAFDAEVCSGSPLFDEFSTIVGGQSRTGEFSILACTFDQDGTYTVRVDLLDKDYVKLASDDKDVTVSYWSQFW